MTSPRHLWDGWDMHSRGAELFRREGDRLQAGAAVHGIVVCHHAFGMGVYLPDRDEYGHVDITAISSHRLRGPEDFPEIGSEVEATVAGYSGRYDQLRLLVYQPDRAG